MPSVQQHGRVRNFRTKHEAFDYLYRQMEVTLDGNVDYGYDTEVTVKIVDTPGTQQKIILSYREYPEYEVKR